MGAHYAAGRGLAPAVERVMASKTKAAQPDDKEETPEKETSEPPDAPLPLFGLSDAAVCKMIEAAKKRGYVTQEQINSVLPSAEATSERIEDILAMLNEVGINTVESEEAEPGEEAEAREEHKEESEGGKLVQVQPTAPAKVERAESSERTDDPVRMYLREMGSVRLLSREGEIAVAKRIEAGREAMIAGLCESPLSFQAIIIWRDELNDGKVFLRDIIDLEATYAGPGAKAGPAGGATPGTPAALATPFPHVVQAQPAAASSAPPAATPFGPKPQNSDGEEQQEGGRLGEGDIEDDDLENSLSLAALEAELKPKVLETFDTIADTYKKLRRLQDQDIENRLRNDSLSPHQERKYNKLKEELIAKVKSLRLSQARIGALIEQLYDINKRLVSYEGRLMRLSESYGVVREDYQGSELDPRWLNRVSKLSAKGW